MTDNAQKLLVTGASGGLAQLVIRDLLDVHGVAPEHIIAITRSPEKLAHFAARGVAIRKGDFDAPDALIEAFAGADRLLLISVGADPLQSYLNDIDPIGDPNRRRVVARSAPSERQNRRASITSSTRQRRIQSRQPFASGSAIIGIRRRRSARAA